jgi:hypothetical protein
VAGQLLSNRARNARDWSRFDKIWSGYEKYRDAVLASGPSGLSLREKDRYLWGMSSARQLEKDIAARFSMPSEPG